MGEVRKGMAESSGKGQGRDWQLGCMGGVNDGSGGNLDGDRFCCQFFVDYGSVDNNECASGSSVCDEYVVGCWSGV